MKKIVLAVVVLAVIAAGVFFGLRGRSSSPAHALAQIGAAVKARDLELFRRHVDLDSLLDRGLTSLLAAKDNDGWMTGLAKGAGSALKPTLAAGLKEGIESWVATGATTDASGPVRAFVNAKVAELGQLELRDVSDVSRDQPNSTATVRLRHRRYDCELTAQVLLRQTPEGSFQLVEVTNIVDLMGQLLDGEAAWKQRENARVRKEIDALLRIEDLEKSSRDELLGLRRKLVFTATVRNRTDQAVVRAEAVLTAATLSEPRATKKWKVSFDRPIPAGQTEVLTWEFGANAFKAGETAIYQAKDDGLSITLEVESITLEGGRQIQVPYPE